MKYWYRGALPAAAVVAVCLAAYAQTVQTAYPFLEVTDGGIRMGGLGDPGDGVIQFLPSASSHIRDVPDLTGETGYVGVTGEDRAILISSSGNTSLRSMVEVDGYGHAKMKGRLVDEEGVFYGTSGVNANADGSAHMVSVPSDETIKKYARVSTLKEGTAIMVSRAAASVECSKDGDVVITLGASQQQQKMMMGDGEGGSSLSSAQAVEMELPPGMMTPHHDAIDYYMEQELAISGS